MRQTDEICSRAYWVCEELQGERGVLGLKVGCEDRSQPAVTYTGPE
jgi:hypothetical protein